MAIRVVTVPAPAAGHEWTYTVPGQWALNLVAASATLVTLQNPATSPDQSGNLRPLNYTGNAFTTWGVTGPFAGGGGFAVQQGIGALNQTTQIGTRPASTDWNVATISVGGFIKFNNASQANLWGADLVVAAAHHGWRVTCDGSSPQRIGLQWRAGGAALNLCSVPIGAWHLVTVTYDGVNARGYVDGVLGAAPAAVAAVDAVAEPMWLGGSVEPGNDFPVVAAMAGWFVNAAVLGAPRLVTYFNDATTVSAAQYQADVLADAPLALWMLGDLTTTPSRTATLQLTDGTSVIGTYPGGTISGSAPSFQWTWSTQGAALAQSAGAQVNLVGIPNITLPPGYTIGTRTLDLAATDKWGPITLWFDDGTGPSGGTGGAAGGVDYLDVLLVPDYFLR